LTMGFFSSLKSNLYFEARIIAVSDAFDAMTSARPHRSMMPLVDVLRELERGKGKQFDPQIVDIFLNEKIYEF